MAISTAIQISSATDHRRWTGLANHARTIGAALGIGAATRAQIVPGGRPGFGRVRSLCKLITEACNATTKVWLRSLGKQPRHLTLGGDAHSVAQLTVTLSKKEVAKPKTIRVEINNN